MKGSPVLGPTQEGALGTWDTEEPAACSGSQGLTLLPPSQLSYEPLRS